VPGGQGTIGYADESQAGELGKVSVKVGEQFVAPTPEAAAAVVEASPRVEGQGQYNFAVELARDTTASGSYPIVLVSYDIACTRYPDAATANVTKAFLNYVISADGQQAAAGAAGNAPITDAQRSQFQPAVDAIAGGS
jgi:phosphate transport system substrate-binding protein